MMATAACHFKYPVLGVLGDDGRDVNDLSIPNQLDRIARYVIAAKDTVGWLVLNRKIGAVCHSQGVAFVPSLPAGPFPVSAS
jgi:hypothetical protein